MSGIVPGELLPADDPVRINEGRETTAVTVENTGDRPVQVGSHFHFFEVNPGLRFDRERAYGFRLNVPAGTAVRFEPGQQRAVELVAIGGDRIVHGMSGLVEGPLDDEDVRERALERARERGFLGIDTEDPTAGGDEP
ncbi:urease subunit beta [Natronococcus occultus]|uniref:Urease subunit beta n=1 Tax=Natronococcus occultus SP4 TaxID=694430 RepID=L0JZM2_9EURY|nr:urease subunit beta [Natronococcus occultus]AGB37293.1 urease, beta subunit [Natronococcus occultus SP4]